ncbi:hypothetical protein SLNSH_22685 [Alsobacter soli]|uniref:Uncharacterized protein n=1 Tax=Alsobacter soli TaxID=2109933 RepID=A0A2T1HM04_9HYPH|nr:hypothetical protein SLNSH_22685 [Alsobacter soli]
MSRHRRLWTGPDAEEYLAALREWRRRCVAILTKAPIRSPIALATTEIMHAIDGAAEVITGDRESLWSKPASTGPEMRARFRETDTE